MKGTMYRIGIALAAVAALVTITIAATTGTAAIRERQEAMGAVGQAMGKLAAIAKNEAPFDAEVVKTQAQTIAAELKKSADLFPEGSDKGEVETWAMAEIWSDREAFEKSFQSAIEAAVAMQSVTEEAAFLPALGAIGSGCKGCHQNYRRPKN